MPVSECVWAWGGGEGKQFDNVIRPRPVNNNVMAVDAVGEVDDGDWF